MPLKKAQGNMYNWVTHTWNALIGQCPHECDYCYVSAMKKRFPNTSWMYEGEPRLNSQDFVFIPYEQQKDWHQYHPTLVLGENKKIFVAHTGDLFAEKVPTAFILEILNLCSKYPNNQYIFQTKNPQRYGCFMDYLYFDNVTLGTTIETDDGALLMNHSKAPSPLDRAIAIRGCKNGGMRTFVTIEPLMKFQSVDRFISLIELANPTFINIGADSKKCSLPEPSKEDIETLLKGLADNNIPIRIKENLERLMQ